MYQYDGYIWPSLKAACRDLGLEYELVQTWLTDHDSTLAEYIRLHRFVVKGLIFSSLEGAAIYLGVDPDVLQDYMDHGYQIDLAAHMIRRKLPIDYFTLPKGE